MRQPARKRGSFSGTVPNAETPVFASDPNPFSGLPRKVGLACVGNQAAIYSAGGAVHAACASQTFDNGLACNLGGKDLFCRVLPSWLTGKLHPVNFPLTKEILLTVTYDYAANATGVLAPVWAAFLLIGLSERARLKRA